MIGKNKRKKIAYLSASDPWNIHAWSGTLYYMAKALEKHCGDIFPLGPVEIKKHLSIKPQKELSKYYKDKSYNSWCNFSIALDFAKTFEKKLSEHDFDLIFAPIASTELSFLDCKLPIIYLSDTTFNLANNYNPYFLNFLNISILEGNIMEEMCLKKSNLILYPTEWAAKSAQMDYGIDKSKIHIIPFGANIDYTASKDLVLKKRKSDKCRLFFMGTDWNMKGGNIAFDTLLYLRKMGIDAELTVCGCTPPSQFNHNKLKVIPFLDKNNRDDIKKLYELYLNSDFFILPSKSDCFGIVFAEASAFGVPSITSNTGGISYVVKNSENGFTLSPDSSGLNYAELIYKIYKDDNLYYNLVKSSRETYEKRLNWDTWGSKVNTLINNKL